MMTQTYPYEILHAGIAIIPVRYRDKRPDGLLLPSHSWDLYQTTLPSVNDLNRWFLSPHNYGIVAGWHGLMILDFDEIGEYTKWRLWATKNPKTRFISENAFQVATSRGVHVYLRTSIPGTNKKIGKIDVKYRGYVLGPGSIHPTGTEYRAIKPALFFPLIQSLSDVLPTELLTQATLPEGVKRPASAPQGNDPWVTAMEPQPVATGAVEKIKSTLRIEDFFTHLKPTSKDGRWFMTCCPLHDDNHPSFWVDTKLQICGCHAHCVDKPMDVIDLYARLHGLTNGESIRILANSI